jgi:putative transposon-encoded protein
LEKEKTTMAMNVGKVKQGRKSPSMVKFEVYGDELIEKTVKESGKTGRVYLPPEWVGKRVKVVRYPVAGPGCDTN